MKLATQTVSSLISTIKRSLESEYRDVIVVGEVSNLSQSSAGHWYFTLSDEQASLSCALFKGDALRNPYIRRCQDGEKVTISGPISVYLRRGSFQLVVKKLVPAGKGDLKAQFEKLKKKLASEGLFDLDKKKPLPIYAKKIAVITAIRGAALQDFLNVFLRRSLWCHIVIIPAQVQGEKSPLSLMEALEKASHLEELETIVMTRGGGSMEDLWAFNDEVLIRKMAESKVPIISAVGHQVDYTLSDFVADYRCETPTAAAEILTQPHTEMRRRMSQSKERLESLLEKKHYLLQSKLQNLHPRRILDKVFYLFHSQMKRLNSFNLSNRLHELTRVNEFQMVLDELSVKAIKSIEKKYREDQYRLTKGFELINAYGPEKVLKRGYAIIQRKDETVIPSKKEFNSVETGEDFYLKFHDGQVRVKN